MTLTPSDELERLQSRSTKSMAGLLGQIEVARLQGDYPKVDLLTAVLGTSLTEALASADLLGRRRLMLELRDRGMTSGSLEFNAFRVPFLQAIADLVGRIPGLAVSADEVRELWRGRGFAVAHAATLEVTNRVRKTITSFLRQNATVTTDQAVGQIHSLLSSQAGAPGGITRAYADTVFRTVTSTAYQEGRRAQGNLPGVRREASGWEYDPIGDADTRRNHKAGKGFVAHMDDPIWETHAPPNGFNCRCSTTLVSTDRMVALGLSDELGNPTSFVGLGGVISRGFRPDPGFR